MKIKGSFLGLSIISLIMFAYFLIVQSIVFAVLTMVSAIFYMHLTFEGDELK